MTQSWPRKLWRSMAAAAKPHDAACQPAGASSAYTEELLAPPGAASNGVSVEQAPAAEPGLSARNVAVFAFTMTCGGPFGVEDCVRSAGIGWTIIGLFSVGFMYIMPQILMTAELAMITPLSNGGVISWASRAFGRNASMLAALNMLVYQLVDLATYSTLCAGYAQSLGVPEAGGLAYLAPVIVIAIGYFFNLLNIEIACTLYMWLLLVVLLPVFIGIGCSIPHWGTSWTDIFEGSDRLGQGNLNLFASTLFWLNTGWDSMGNLATTVRSPQDLVRGLVGAGWVVPCLYAVCLVAAAGAGPSPWDDGYLAVAYGTFLGPLRGWMCFSAGLSTILLYLSELTTAGLLVQSMGDPAEQLGLLPSWFGVRIRTGAPANALLAITLLQVCLAQSNFGYLVQLSTLLHVIAFWIEVASYVALKRRGVERLWQVPGGSFGGWLVVLSQLPVLLFLLASSTLDISVVLGAAGANACVAVIMIARCWRQ